MIDQAMGRFLSACGATGPFVLGVEEPGSASVSWRVFDQPFIVVGRDPCSDLRLDHAEVSWHHAYLQLIAGRLFCVDLHSSTGTRWGDVPGLWGWVHSGTRIGIGPFRLTMRAEGPEPPALQQDEESSLPVPISKSFVQHDLPEVVVEILSASVGVPSWRVSRSLVLIGSSLACRIRLEGGGVAEVHASLLRTPSGVFAVDLLEKGGIRMNGEPVRYARIGEDDEIAVGCHRIRVRCSPPEARSGRSLASIRRGPSGGPRHPARGEVGRRAPAGVTDTRPSDSQAPSSIPHDATLIVRSMLDEFAQVQSRMADRFQESMLLVVQAFIKSHRDQMALIHKELACIRELTEEQAALRSQVENTAHRPAESPSFRLVSIDPGDSSAGLLAGIATPAPGAGRTVSTPNPAVPSRGGQEGSTADLAASRIKESQAHRPEPPIPAEMHAQIARRLAEIQDERQGCWQKLMRTFLG